MRNQFFAWSLAFAAGCGSGQAQRATAPTANILGLFDSLSAIHRDHPDTALLRRLHPPADTLLYVEGPKIEAMTGDSLFKRVIALHRPVKSMKQVFSSRSMTVLDSANAVLVATERVDWVDTQGAHVYEGVLTIAVSRRSNRWVIRAYHGT
jgi:hypothetical protein